MQETISGAIAIAICTAGCIWGWWMENGPGKERKEEQSVMEKECEKENDENEKDKSNLYNRSCQ